MQNDQWKDMGIYSFARIWDETDYLVSSSNTDDFFIMTNLILTPDQQRKRCPEDHTKLPSMICENEYDRNHLLVTVFADKIMKS